MIKSRPTSDIVDHDGTTRTAIIWTGNGAKSKFCILIRPYDIRIKDRGNDWIALFSSSNLTYTPLMYFNQTYMVYRAFAELLESRKKFEKSSHGPKLSKKSHEKVNALQAKKF